jgi:hypothetical protein
MQPKGMKTAKCTDNCKRIQANEIMPIMIEEIK